MGLYTREHLIGTERIYDGLIFNVRKDLLQKPDQQIWTREVVEHNGGVVIVAQPNPDSVILIKQYRYTVDEEILELPAGRVEQGEERFPAAQRELTEETGYVANRWSNIAGYFSAPGFCTELLSFYKAEDLEFQGKRLDEDEETEVVIISLEEAKEMIRAGKFRDAKTVAGLAAILI